MQTKKLIIVWKVMTVKIMENYKKKIMSFMMNLKLKILQTFKIIRMIYNNNKIQKILNKIDVVFKVLVMSYNLAEVVYFKLRDRYYRINKKINIINNKTSQI